MPDEQGNPTGSKPAEESAESLTNLKAEMDRKLSNTTEQMQKLQEQNQKLIDQMTLQQQTLQTTQKLRWHYQS